MLSLTIFTNDLMDHYNFICSSFTIAVDGCITIYFDNGTIHINGNKYTDLIVYPHNTVDTDVFNPGLLNSTRR